MYSHFNSEITWLIYDILLLFYAGFAVSLNVFVCYFFFSYYTNEW